MSIHYAHEPSRKYAKTACGHVFDMCSPGECLSNDTESIDCEECLASDEFKAQSMERALKGTNVVPVRGATADFVYYDESQDFEDA